MPFEGLIWKLSRRECGEHMELPVETARPSLVYPVSVKKLEAELMRRFGGMAGLCHEPRTRT